MSQVVAGRDGYAYYFTSMAEGPVTTTMTLKQILVLLHIIHSFIPRECILETDSLKPTFNKQGGLEKLVEQVAVAEEDCVEASRNQQSMSSLPVCEAPMDLGFNLRNADTESASQAPDRLPQKHFRTSPVDVAEILLAPVCVTYTISSGGPVPSSSDMHGNSGHDHESGGGENKMLCYWLVVLKTRKCYNFNEHLRWMVNELDREDKTHVKKFANKEYEDVLYMLREVVLYQYENNPDTTVYLRQQVFPIFHSWTLNNGYVLGELCTPTLYIEIKCLWQGSTFRVDPFQRMTEMDSPDTLDSVCSVYAAYRSMVFQVSRAGKHCSRFVVCG